MSAPTRTTPPRELSPPLPLKADPADRSSPEHVALIGGNLPQPPEGSAPSSPILEPSRVVAFVGSSAAATPAPSPAIPPLASTGAVDESSDSEEEGDESALTHGGAPTAATAGGPPPRAALATSAAPNRSTAGPSSEYTVVTPIARGPVAANRPMAAPSSNARVAAPSLDTRPMAAAAPSPARASAPAAGAAGKTAVHADKKCNWQFPIGIIGSIAFAAIAVGALLCVLGKFPPAFLGGSIGSACTLGASGLLFAGSVVLAVSYRPRPNTAATA